MHRPDKLRCPSAQLDMEGATVFGIVDGEPGQRRVAYLRGSANIDLKLLPDLGQARPTQVFRIAAACEESQCTHYGNGRCALAQRIVARLEPVVDELPPCRIRPDCRWYAEHGAAACYRCPQVTTLASRDNAALAGVATASLATPGECDA